jgi:DNA-binding MarR family transcriptional regulator
MSEGPRKESTPCGYVLGEDGLARWSERHSDAWIGLLETHKRLTRALDGELEAEHGVTLSSLEVLGRLASVPDQRLRLSRLATACGLSLSRISRIMDALEARGLVTRGAVTGDARAVEGRLTETGLELVRRAQCSHFAAVQRRFFEHLSEAEIATLASVFSRFTPADAAACTAGEEAGNPAGAGATPR